MIKNNQNENLKKCPYWQKCSMNLCPLDSDIDLRVGKRDDKCRWMKVPRQKNIKGREFMSGGNVMPKGLLVFVPIANIKHLNSLSQKEWRKITTNIK